MQEQQATTTTSAIGTKSEVGIAARLTELDDLLLTLLARRLAHALMLGDDCYDGAGGAGSSLCPHGHLDQGTARQAR
jgi:hypothetical protein